MSDTSGIGKLRTAMLLYLIGSILGIVGYIYGVSQALGGGAVPVTSNFAALIPYLAIFIIGLVLAILAVFYMRSGFSILARSNSNYKLGATGALLDLIGIILVVLAVIVIFVSLLSLSSASPSSGLSAVGVGIGGSLAALALFGIGGLLAFVGTILLVVGFYRIGSDSNSGIVKAGAILYLLIPFIGVILLYIGLKDAQRGTPSSGQGAAGQ